MLLTSTVLIPNKRLLILPVSFETVMKYNKRLQDDLRRFLLLNLKIKELLEKSPAKITDTLLSEHAELSERIGQGFVWLLEVERQAAVTESAEYARERLKRERLGKKNGALCRELEILFAGRKKELAMLIESHKKSGGFARKAFFSGNEPFLLDIRY
jgi:hypothetical protein